MINDHQIKINHQFINYQWSPNNDQLSMMILHYITMYVTHCNIYKLYISMHYDTLWCIAHCRTVCKAKCKDMHWNIKQNCVLQYFTIHSNTLHSSSLMYKSHNCQIAFIYISVWDDIGKFWITNWGTNLVNLVKS